LAIETNGDQHNHVYFANRANVYLELERNEEAIADCNHAIKIEPSFAKSYFRKANGLLNMKKNEEALAALKDGLKVEPENQAILELQAVIEDEIKASNLLPADHHQKAAFNSFFEGLKQRGVKFDKFNVRHYTDNNRGVHAGRDIKGNEVICSVPKDLILPLPKTFETPLGKILHEGELYNRVENPKNIFHSIYLLQQQRLKREEQEFPEWMDSLPKSMDEYPLFFKQEDYDWLEGSPINDEIRGRQD